MKVDQIFESKFKGKKICFTGKLAHMTRDEAAAIIRSLGAEFSSSLTQSTDILVVGDKPGSSGSSKLAKAQDYGVPVKQEGQFFKELRDAGIEFGT